MDCVRAGKLENQIVTKTLILMLCGLLGGLGGGCASVAAMNMPGPTNDEAVKVGMHRSEVEGYLGVGPASEYDDEDKVVTRYEYSDGPSGASKVRVLVYVAADIFTVFLSELIFWPIESYATEQVERVATAHFAKNTLVAWNIARGDGEQLSSDKVDDVSASEPSVEETPGMEP